MISNDSPAPRDISKEQQLNIELKCQDDLEVDHPEEEEAEVEDRQEVVVVEEVVDLVEAGTCR